MTRSENPINPKLSSALKYRRSLQKIVKRRHGPKIQEDKVSLAMLGLEDVTVHRKWILDRILLDMHPEDLDLHSERGLQAEDLVCTLLELTPQNFSWLQALFNESGQGLSYIVNRLIESCRFDVPWVIHKAPPADIVKAKMVAKEWDRKYKK